MRFPFAFYLQRFCICGSRQPDPSSEVSRFPLRHACQEHRHQLAWNVLKGHPLLVLIMRHYVCSVMPPFVISHELFTEFPHLFFAHCDFRYWLRERRPGQGRAGSTLTLGDLWLFLLKVQQYLHTLTCFYCFIVCIIPCEKTEQLMVTFFKSEFPAPKNELFQHFHVYYLGSEAVAKPVGKKTPSLGFNAILINSQCFKCYYWDNLAVESLRLMYFHVCVVFILQVWI